MYFVLECFLVTLFSASFFASVIPAAPVLPYGIVSFSALMWIRITEKHTVLLSVAINALFIGWFFFVDMNILFFAPVLLIGGFPCQRLFRPNNGKAYNGIQQQRNTKSNLYILTVKLFFVGMNFFYFNTAVFIFTVLIFFYSSVKIYDNDMHEILMSMKDALTESKREHEEQKRRLQTDVLKNSEVAVLAERNRISRSLHNSIGHTLSSAILQVNALKYLSTQEEVKTSLTILQNSLEKGMTEIRECLHNIHNDSFDLQTSLELLIAKTAGLKISFTCKTDTVPYTLKHDIVSIVKECISNTIKHSGASEMSITVMEQPAFYSVSVWDNGCGLNSPTGNGTGIGLTVLRETVEKNNGAINFYSDAGFKVHIVFPKEIHTL